MTPTSKQLVRTALSGRTAPRPPFIPWLGSYAANVEQVAVQEMMTDIPLMARALENARRLFDCDAIVVGFDSTLEAEACGCEVEWSNDGAVALATSHALAEGVNIDDATIDGLANRGRLPILLEATRRLIATAGRNVGIIGHVTGALTLSSHLLGRDVLEALAEETTEAERALEASGRVIAKVCRLYGDLGVDAVLIAEDALSRGMPALISTKVKRALQQAVNVAKFYNISTIILGKGPFDAQQVQAISGLGINALALGGASLTADQTAVDNRRIAVGRTVPLSLLASDRTDIAHALPGLLSDGNPVWPFLTTEWDVPYDTPVDNLHEVARIYREFVASRTGV